MFSNNFHQEKKRKKCLNFYFPHKIQIIRPYVDCIQMNKIRCAIFLHLIIAKNKNIKIKKLKCSTVGDLVTLLIKTLISLKIYPKILLVNYGIGGYAITWAFSFTATPFVLEDFLWIMLKTYKVAFVRAWNRKTTFK